MEDDYNSINKWKAKERASKLSALSGIGNKDSDDVYDEEMERQGYEEDYVLKNSYDPLTKRDIFDKPRAKDRASKLSALSGIGNKDSDDVYDEEMERQGYTKDYVPKIK